MMMWALEIHEGRCRAPVSRSGRSLRTVAADVIARTVRARNVSSIAAPSCAARPPALMDPRAPEAAGQTGRQLVHPAAGDPFYNRRRRPSPATPDTRGAGHSHRRAALRTALASCMLSDMREAGALSQPRAVSPQT
jgi:hypothetical protein